MKFKCYFFITAFLLLSINSSAKNIGDSIFLEHKPEYIVKTNTQNASKSLIFNLKKRGVRLLPSFFVDSEVITEADFKPSPYASKVEVIQQDSKKYCDKKKRICWPKKIELIGKFIKVTSFNGDYVFYNDNNNLAEFLWGEIGNEIER